MLADDLWWSGAIQDGRSAVLPFRLVEYRKPRSAPDATWLSAGLEVCGLEIAGSCSGSSGCYDGQHDAVERMKVGRAQTVSTTWTGRARLPG